MIKIIGILLIVGVFSFLKADTWLDVMLHHENNFFLSWLLEWAQDTNSPWVRYYEQLYTPVGLITLGIFINLFILIFVLIQYVYQLATLDKTGKLTMNNIIEMFIWKGWTNNIIFKIIVLTAVSMVLLKPVTVVLMKPYIKNNQVKCWVPDVNSHNGGAYVEGVDVIDNEGNAVGQSEQILNKETIHVPLILALPIGLIEKFIYGFSLEEIPQENNEEEGGDLGNVGQSYKLPGMNDTDVVLTLVGKDTNEEGESFLFSGAFKKMTLISAPDINTLENCEVGNSFTKFMGANVDTLGDAGAPIRKMMQLFSLQEQIANVSLNNNITKYKKDQREKSLKVFEDKLKVLNTKLEKYLFTDSGELNEVLYTDEIRRINGRLNGIHSILSTVINGSTDVNAPSGTKLLANILLADILPKKDIDTDIYEHGYAVNQTKSNFEEKCVIKETPLLECDTKDSTAKNSTMSMLLKLDKLERNTISTELSTTTNNNKVNKSYFTDPNTISKFFHGNDIDGFGKTTTTAHPFIINSTFTSSSYADISAVKGDVNNLAAIHTGFSNKAIYTDTLNVKLGASTVNVIKENKYLNTAIDDEKPIRFKINRTSNTDEDGNTLDTNEKEQTKNGFSKISLDFETKTLEGEQSKFTIGMLKYLFWSKAKDIVFINEGINGKFPKLFDKTSFETLFKNSQLELELPNGMNTQLPFKMKVKETPFDSFGTTLSLEVDKYLNLTKLIYEVNYYKNLLKELDKFLSDKQTKINVFANEIRSLDKFPPLNINKWLKGESSISGFALNPYMSQLSKIKSPIKVFKRLQNAYTDLTTVKEYATVRRLDDKIEIKPYSDNAWKNDLLFSGSIKQTTFIGSATPSTTNIGLNSNLSYIYSQQASEFYPEAVKKITNNEDLEEEYASDTKYFYSKRIVENVNSLKKGSYGNKFENYFSIETNIVNDSIIEITTTGDVTSTEKKYCDDENDLLGCIYGLTSITSLEEGDIPNITFESNETPKNRITESYYLYFDNSTKYPNIENMITRAERGDLNAINTYRVSQITDILDMYITQNENFSISGQSYNLLLRDLMKSMISYLNVDTTNNTIKWKEVTELNERQKNRLNKYLKQLKDVKNIIQSDNSSLMEECLPSSYANSTGDEIKSFIKTMTDEKLKNKCINLSGAWFSIRERVDPYVAEAMEIISMEYDENDRYELYRDQIIELNDKVVAIRTALETLPNNFSDFGNESDSIPAEKFFKVLSNVLVLNSQSSIFKTNTLFWGSTQDLGESVADGITALYNKGVNEEYERIKKVGIDYRSTFEVKRSVDFVKYIGEDFIREVTVSFSDKSDVFEITSIITSVVIGLIKILILFSFTFTIITILVFAIIATVVGWSLILVAPLYAYFSQVAIDNYRSFMQDNGGSNLIRIIDNINNWLFKLVIASTIVYVVFTIVLLVINTTIYNFGYSMLITNYLDDIIVNGVLSATTEIKVFGLIIMQVLVVIFVTSILLGMLKKWLKETAVEGTQNMASLMASAVKDVTTNIKVK